MDITKMVVLAILGAFLSAFLREYKAYLALAISVVTAVAVLYFVFPEMERVISYAKLLYHTAGGKNTYIDCILKISGIVCLTQISGDILKEGGLPAASYAVSMTGKVVCIGLCMPILSALFETVISILP